MGCGSSSLRGDASVGTDMPAQPSTKSSNTLINPNAPTGTTGASLKKTTTKFEDVDYASGRSRDPTKASIMVDRAPDEMDPVKKASVASPEIQEDRPALKPYNTFDGNDVEDMQQERVYPHEHLNTERPVNGLEDDIMQARNRKNKDVSNMENEPMTQNEEEGRKKSLFQRLKEGRDESGKKRTKSYTDEDLQQYTGLSRQEFDKHHKDMEHQNRSGQNVVNYTPLGVS